MSAGILLYRVRDGQIEVFLGHMGGPFWANKDERGWSIPKGEYEPDEEPFAAARREFEEEIGSAPPEGPALGLGEVRQSSGKRVVAWAVEGDLDPSTVSSNTFVIEWPPRSGRRQEFPEVDRAGWFTLEVAKEKLLAAQAALLEELEQVLEEREPRR